MACDTYFSDEFLDFSETSASLSGLNTLGDAPWYFITQQSSFVVLRTHSLMLHLFLSETLQILYWQMRAQLVSGLMGPMGG